MNNLNLIIPMAGVGKRFQRAGYEIFKPFISVKGKPMIKHVTDAFSSSVRKFVVTSRSLLSEEQVDYLENHLLCKIIDIPLHDQGPAFSIYQARNELPLSESFFISYCDIFWHWNFEKILKDLSFDGVVYTHTGFHPHLIQNNYSAFCLPKNKNSSQLKEIREKESFTDNWMNEPISIGLFYIKNGMNMLDGIANLINKDIRVSGEYFPSLIFNYLIAQNQQIFLNQVDFFIHWGVPEQLRDFEHWDTIISQRRVLPSVKKRDCPKLVVCMAGSGKRMKNSFQQPKALIPIDGTPMFQYIMDRFPSRSSTIITTAGLVEELKEYDIDSELVVLEEQTPSQFDTLLQSLDIIRTHRDFFLISCDAYGLFDFTEFMAFTKNRKPDVIIFTHEPSLTHRKMVGHHSHVSVEGDRITAVHIKSISKSDDYGFAGFFWVKDGCIFDCMPDMTRSKKNEMSVDHVFKYFVDLGLDVASFFIDQYVHLGTPDELSEFRYWLDREYLFI